MDKVTSDQAITKILCTPDPVLLMVIGVPGCGKSTFIDRLLNEAVIGDFVVASTDNLIEAEAKKLHKTYSEVFDRFIKPCTRQFKVMVAEAMNSNQNLIIDRTQVGRKARQEHLGKASPAYKKFAITFDVSDEVIFERLDARAKKTGKKIPAFVVKSMKDRYEEPTVDEGFDVILSITSD